jgi:Uma2 family endonuclease
MAVARHARTPERGDPPEHEDRVVLSGVPWATYVVLRDSIESASIRMTYLEGRLEIMSPSRRHEVNKKQVARLLELFALEKDIPLHGYGSTTFRVEARARGLEPDECYCRGDDRPVPDIALEVVVSAPAIDKLEVHRGLAVREVWFFEKGAFQLFALRGEDYQPIAASEVLPEVDLTMITEHAGHADQHTALRELRDRLRRG